MQIFKPLYEYALRWSRHPQAERFLAGLSFIEAFFFPIAPEAMLAPMTLARSERWIRYASISLVFSLLGAIVGYLIGYFAIAFVEPILKSWGYWPKFLEVQKLAIEHGFWLLLVGGFTPVPLKIFTLASGAVSMPIWSFLAGMVIGRGKRVYLLAGLIRLGGERAEQALHRWIEWIGWALVGLVILIIIYFSFFR